MPLRLLLLACLLLPGCRLPDEPDRQTAPYHPFTCTVSVQPDSLKFTVTGDGEVQLFLNMDENNDTGYTGYGYDFVVRPTDSDSAEVRGPCSDFSWGDLTGWAKIVRYRESGRTWESVTRRGETGRIYTFPRSAVSDSDGFFLWRADRYQDGSLKGDLTGSTRPI